MNETEYSAEHASRDDRDALRVEAGLRLGLMDVDGLWLGENEAGNGPAEYDSMDLAMAAKTILSFATGGKVTASIRPLPDAPMNKRGEFDLEYTVAEAIRMAESPHMLPHSEDDEIDDEPD